MIRRYLPCLFSLLFVALYAGYQFPLNLPGAVAQDAKKDDAKKDGKKADAPKQETKKDDAKKDNGPKKGAKKEEGKKVETKKDEIKEEPKKEPFVPDTPAKELKGHSDWINALVISSDGKYIATASRDRTVKVWQIDTAKDVATLKGSPENIKGVVFLDGSGKLASTTGKWNKEKKYWEGEIKIWDAKAQKQIKSIKGHAEPIDGLAISKDGKLLASASEDQTVKIWNLASGKDVLTLKGHTDVVEAVAFSGDGKKLATASADKTVRIWDAASGKQLALFKAPIMAPEPKKDAKEPAKKDTKKVEKKDNAKKGQKKKGAKKETKKEEPKDLARPFTCVAFSPDSKLLVAGNLDGLIKIYDVEAAKEIGQLKAHEGVWALAFSPDGGRLASGGWDNTIKVWGTNSRKDIQTIKAHNGTVTALAFSPDGKSIISGSIDATVKIWKAVAAPAQAAARVADGFRAITKGDLLTRIPSFFYFDYPGDLEAGKRLWIRVDNDHWIERYPSGLETKFKTLGRTKLDNIEGTVVERLPDMGLRAFIPDLGASKMQLRFQSNEAGNDRDWHVLAEMKKIE